jgi:hypothetical protein
MTAGNDMVRGRANSFTEAGLRINRSTMLRRLGSTSAWNTWSRLSPWLGMYLTIRGRRHIVKYMLNFRQSILRSGLAPSPTITITAKGQVAYLKAAACMRAHGLPEFEDPSSVATA